MTLASLVDDGPVLSITFNRRQDSSSCISWSDFPIVGDEEVYNLQERPLEHNPYVIEKANETILISPPSALSWESSISWSDFPIIERGCENGPSRENKTFCQSPSFTSASSTASTSSTMSMSEDDAICLDVLKPRRKLRKTVSFNKDLEIRQHALTIGDHPLCRDSLPISLAWEHGDTMLMDLDGFEAQRQGLRRSRSEMKLSYFERKNMLRNVSGFTEADMIDEQRRIQNSS